VKTSVFGVRPYLTPKNAYGDRPLFVPKEFNKRINMSWKQSPIQILYLYCGLFAFQKEDKRIPTPTAISISGHQFDHPMTKEPPMKMRTRPPINFPVISFR
jgi:hypothetical protein